jgi:ComF family protein
MQFFKSLAVDLFQLLFPNLCNGCGQCLIKTERLLCLNCLFDLPYTDFHLFADNRVAKQLWGRIPCSYAVAMLYFRKGSRVQQMLHNLKYRGKAELGDLLGEMLGSKILQGGIAPAFDVIIPVPLHKKREKIRGYNQSQRIAEGLSAKINVPVINGLLLKLKATSSQTKKGRFNRYENLKAAFSIKDASQLLGKHVLLVDDVVTTGATLEACMLVLLAAGSKSISIAAVAYAE